MEEKVQFHFWTMFTLPQLEQWLDRMAEQGWILSRVKAHYFFTFHKDKPLRMTYQADFRGYILDGYLREMESQGWLRQNLSHNWQLFYRSYGKEFTRLHSSLDQEMAEGINRNSITSLVVLVIVTFVGYQAVRKAQSMLALVLLIIMILIAIYNILRMQLYRAMLLERSKNK